MKRNIKIILTGVFIFILATSCEQKKSQDIKKNVEVNSSNEIKNSETEIEIKTETTVDNNSDSEDNSYLLSKDDSELNQLELNIKSQLVFEIVDKELNMIYKEIMSDYNISEERKNELRKEQRIWLKETHSNCNQESKDFEDSTMYNQILNNCLIEKTKLRIIELKLLKNN